MTRRRHKNDPVYRDLQATTALELTWRWEEDESLSVVGPHGSGSRWPSSGQGDWVWLADHLQDQYVIEALGRAWPRCIAHGRHPMRAIMANYIAMWVCPHEPQHRVPIGELRSSDVPEPSVDDNRVRWFRDDWGWGVIAHSEGDIWFHYTSIEMKGYRKIAEDQPVECESVMVPHAGFKRRADKVRLAR